jgi:AraC family transcriptional regulator
MLTLNKGEYSGNILQLMECQGIVASKTGYKNDYNQSIHYHANPHLSFILNGALTERKQNQTQLKTTKDILFYHSGELHQTISLTPTTQNLNLEIDALFLSNYEISENDLRLAVHENIGSHLFMIKLFTELNFNDELAQTSLSALLLQFVSETNCKDYKQINWCLKLQEILNDEWNHNHSLDELSLKLGVHPVTISKHFSKYFGCTLGEYVRKVRIVRSLEMIKSTTYSLSEIAYICGFSDQSHFIRTFKHLTGLNPKTFQKF